MYKLGSKKLAFMRIRMKTGLLKGCGTEGLIMFTDGQLTQTNRDSNDTITNSGFYTSDFVTECQLLASIS